MSTTLFGIKNCDTVKKARRWLEEHNISYEFQDFRDTPVSTDTMQHWLDAVGMDKLLNKRSTSFRALSEDDKTSNSDAHWLALMQQTPTLIKRPVLQRGNQVHTGFKAEQYQEIFA